MPDDIKDVEITPSEENLDERPTTDEQPDTPTEEQIDDAISQLLIENAKLRGKVEELERRVATLESGGINGRTNQREPGERNWYLRPIRRRA